MQSLKKQQEHAFTQFELTNYLLQNLNKFNLTPTAKLVLLELSSFYNPKKADMFPKQKTIADKLGISEASVIRAVSELHKEGLIISERKYTNRYKFTARIVSEQLESEKIFTQNKMQVENNQNEIKETCNLIAHEHEQIKETKKKQTTVVVDFNSASIPNIIKNNPKIKNPKAYWASLSENVKKEYLNKEAEKVAYIKKEKERKEELRAYIAEITDTSKAEDPNTLSCWKELGKKLGKL